MMYLHLLYTRLHTSTSEPFHAHLVHRLHLVVDIIDHSINEMEVVVFYPLNPCPKAFSSLNDMPK